MKQYLKALLSVAAYFVVSACYESPSEPGSTDGVLRLAEFVERYSADGQSTAAGSQVASAPAVIVKDAQRRPIEGVPVRFVVTLGAGTVGVSNSVTDKLGVASADSWTLGVPGSNEVEARVAGLAPIRFTAISVAAGPSPSGPPVSTAPGFHIMARYLVTASLRQQEAVTRAIARWQAVITSDLADIPLVTAAASCFPGQPALQEAVDDVLILIEFVNMDGAGKTLGEAGPCYVRSDDNLPIVGRLNLDVADLQQMETMGVLDDLVLHEIGHVLGFGTLWLDKSLIVGAGSTHPGFAGTQALSAYQALGGGDPYVPVENGGGTGTRDVHWRESVFGSELMTGWLSAAPNQLSELTIASLLDLGYGANMAAGTEYLPGRATQQSAATIDLRGRERIRVPKWKVNRQGKRSAY